MDIVEEYSIKVIELIRETNDPNAIPIIISQFVLDGRFDVAVQVAAKILIETIESDDDAIQFVLEELDAASHGNEEAFEFSKSVQINPLHFVESMQRSKESVDGIDGPQQQLLLCCMAIGDIEKSCKFRIAVVKKLIEQYNIAKIT